MKKLAYFGFPHLGGTHTAFASLRCGLASHGVELGWFGMGPKARAAFDDPAWAALRDCKTVVDVDGAEDRRTVAVAVLGRDNYDGMLVGSIVCAADVLSAARDPETATCPCRPRLMK